MNAKVDEPTLEELAQRKHPKASCERCPLQSAEFVASSGPPDAAIAVVGEAPGAYEVALGKPFVGQSGQLFNAILDHYGIDRSEVFITNTVLCHPPDNRNPSKLEISSCRTRLLEEIKGARTVVTLGNYASQTVLGNKEGITKARVGPPKVNDLGQRVIPTFHPAAALRSGDFFPHIVTDFSKINQAIDVLWEAPTYKVFDDSYEAAHAVKELFDFPHLVLDIETGLDKDNSFSRSQNLLCIGFCYRPGRAFVVSEEPLKDPMVRGWISDLFKQTQIIAHNGKFDLQGLWDFGQPQLWFDTMLASYADDPRKGTNGLKYLAKEILGAPNYDEGINHTNDMDFGEIPKDELHEYNACDVVATWGLFEHYQQKDRKLHDFLVEASNNLMWVEREGLKVDMEYLHTLDAELSAELETKEVELSRWVANPRSPKQVMEVISKLGRPVTSSNASTLEGLMSKQSVPPAIKEFAGQMLEYRKSHKLHATYVKGLYDQIFDGRVYPSYLLHGTITGRLSSREPNIQNQPRGSRIRNLFIPEDGNVFVQADFKTIELRVLAVLAQDKTLAEIFRSGVDVHDRFTELIYGSEWNKSLRSITKTFVYGAAYGEEAYSAGARLQIPTRTAIDIQGKLMAQMPQVVEFQEDLKTRLLNGEDLTTPFGRKREVFLLTDQNRSDIVKEGFAWQPQSIASDICLTAMCRLRRMLEGTASVRITVHDSIAMECAKEDGQLVADTMTEVMEQTAREVYSDFVPFPADVAIGTRWGDL